MPSLVAADEQASTESDLENELRDELTSLLEREAELDSELDQFIEEQSQTDKLKETTTLIQATVSALIRQAQKTTQIVSNSSVLAERISKQVRQLDLEQSNVKNTLQVVENILDIKYCAFNVEKALTFQEGATQITITQLEEGSEFIKRYLKHDLTTLSTIFEHEMYATSDSQNPLKQLASAKSELKGLLVDAFDIAVQEQTETHIKRLLKLFPAIGEDILGLDKFSAFLCGTLARYCQDYMRTAETLLQKSNGTAMVFGELFTRIYEMVANVIEKQLPFIDQEYGNGKTIRLIQRLQREADIQTCIMIDIFLEKKEIQRKFNEIQGSKFDKCLVDSREVDLILNEVSFMSYKTQLFEYFLLVKATAEIQKLSDTVFRQNAISLYQSNETGLPKSSKIIGRIEELFSNYLTLEEFFLRKSIDRAIKIDQHEVGSHSSSCVEDVFFILKKVTTRAVSSNNLNCFCSVLKLVSRLLEAEYMSYLQRKLSVAFSTTEIKENRSSTMVVVNNVEKTCKYFEKLINGLKSNALNIEKHGLYSSEASQTKVLAAFQILEGSLRTFETILKTWLETTFTQVFKSKVRKIIHDSLHGVSFSYNAGNAPNKTFSLQFFDVTETLISSLMKNYTESNALNLIFQILHYISKELEKYVLQNLKFSPHGALQFDKDIRIINQCFSKYTPVEKLPAVREALSRLNHISTLLNIESLDEVKEIWEDHILRSSSKLSFEEVKKVLALRIDFDVGKIRELDIGV